MGWSSSRPCVSIAVIHPNRVRICTEPSCADVVSTASTLEPRSSLKTATESRSVVSQTAELLTMTLYARMAPPAFTLSRGAGADPPSLFIFCFAVDPRRPFRAAVGAAAAAAAAGGLRFSLADAAGLAGDEKATYAASPAAAAVMAPMNPRFTLRRFCDIGVRPRSPHG